MIRLRTAASVWWRLLSLPATLAHELTHLLLALPWADESAIIFDGRGPAHYVNWQDSVPRSAVVLASLGPTILGSVVGLVGLVLMLQDPPAGRELVLAGGVAAWWVIYVSPSPDDLDLYSAQDNDNGDTNEQTQ
jgi:hypothetical protein